MFAIFVILTVAILFSSAYINHRLFRNSEPLFNMLFFCAAFTSVAELTAFASIEPLKQSLLTIISIHVMIIGLWLVGMWADNKINSKIGDNCNAEKPSVKL